VREMQEILYNVGLSGQEGGATVYWILSSMLLFAGIMWWVLGRKKWM